MKLKLFAGAVALMSIGAGPLPATAATLGLDFLPSTNYTAEVVSAASPGEVVYAYGYEFTLSSGISVTALGTFDNGAIANIGNDNTSNGPNPLVKTGAVDHPGDTVAIYSGTIPNSGNPGGSLSGLTPVASQIVGGTSNTPTQVGGWAFVDLASPVSLSAGSYFILTTYSLVNFDPVAAFPSTIINNDAVALTLGVAENCSVPSNCVLQTSADPGIFGPNFEIGSSSGGNQGETPLPAALPLFAGGLGVLGLLGRRRKNKKAAALAAA